MSLFGKDKNKESVQKYYKEFKEEPTLEKLEFFISHVETLPPEYVPHGIPWDMFTTVLSELVAVRKELKKITGQ